MKCKEQNLIQCSFDHLCTKFFLKKTAGNCEYNKEAWRKSISQKDGKQSKRDSITAFGS
jgi:hypothetical protein